MPLQSIFHPAYRSSHQQTALRLGYLNALVIKGEGGEFERNPDARTLLVGIQNGTGYEVEWPMLNEARSDIEDTFDLEHYLAVWRGEVQHEYGEQAVVGTLALALHDQVTFSGPSALASSSEILRSALSGAAPGP